MDPDGSRYEGHSVNNHFEGQGKMVWEDGGLYEGEVRPLTDVSFVGCLGVTLMVVFRYHYSGHREKLMDMERKYVRMDRYDMKVSGEMATLYEIDYKKS